MHYMYYSRKIDRSNLELPQQLENIWTCNRINPINTGGGGGAQSARGHFIRP